MADNEANIRLSAELTREQLQEYLNKCSEELVTLCNTCEVLTKNMEEILRRIRHLQQKSLAILRLEISQSFNR